MRNRGRNIGEGVVAVGVGREEAAFGLKFHRFELPELRRDRDDDTLYIRVGKNVFRITDVKVGGSDEGRSVFMVFNRGRPIGVMPDRESLREGRHLSFHPFDFSNGKISEKPIRTKQTVREIYTVSKEGFYVEDRDHPYDIARMNRMGVTTIVEDERKLSSLQAARR